jgi:hypothetical protein
MASTYHFWFIMIPGIYLVYTRYILNGASRWILLEGKETLSMMQVRAWM